MTSRLARPLAAGACGALHLGAAVRRCAGQLHCRGPRGGATPRGEQWFVQRGCCREDRALRDACEAYLLGRQLGHGRLVVVRRFLCRYQGQEGS